MVYRGRGRVGGFFTWFLGGGWRGINRCKQSIQGEQKKIDGELIIIRKSLGGVGGHQNPLNPPPPPIQIVVINDDRSQGHNIDEEAITFSLLW